MKNLYFCIRKSIAYEAEEQVVLSVISFVVGKLSAAKETATYA
ncbi:hypothetical protein [Prevotella sp. HMSC077E09]|nr:MULTISPECIES: hypothetical protein [unclassified Prevotella]